MFDKSLQDIRNNQHAYEDLILELSSKFINSFFSAVKTAGMYDANNQRYIEQVAKLRETLGSIFREQSRFSFTTSGGFLYIADIRVKAEQDLAIAATYFMERFKMLGVAGLAFDSRLDPGELDKFIYAFSGLSSKGDIPEDLQSFREKLNQLRIENILPVIFPGQRNDDQEQIDREKYSIRLQARKTFFNAVAIVQDMIAQSKSSNTINIAKTKRVVQQLVNHIIEDENSLLELVSLRKYDDYTYVHSVNVCVLSLVLGFHLGLDRKRLSNLGVGALLHDIGKTKLPIDLVNKPGSFDDYDWQLMRQHPVFGVKALLKTRDMDEITARASATIFEHHIGYDGSGYPELPAKRKPSLFARIVAIADSYNAMSSGRVYHIKRHLPDETITSMVNRVGKVFDPLLLKVFINVMGIFPVGTVVALSSREIGIVSRNNPNDLERPQVKVIANQDGLFDVSEVKIIDLSKEADIKVTKMIDDDKYNIDIAQYLDVK